MSQRHLDAIADSELFPYWFDDADAPDSNPTLVRTESCDLCVVGGGYTGLWTAIVAKERQPATHARPPRPRLRLVRPRLRRPTVSGTHRR